MMGVLEQIVEGSLLLCAAVFTIAMTALAVAFVVIIIQYARGK